MRFSPGLASDVPHMVMKLHASRLTVARIPGYLYSVLTSGTDFPPPPKCHNLVRSQKHTTAPTMYAMVLYCRIVDVAAIERL